MAGTAAAVAGARRLPPAVPAAVALAWTVAVAAELSGTGALLHHDEVADGHLPMALAVPAFLLAWQVMVAAMMLPSALPLVRLFAATSAGQPRPGRVMAVFLAGYGAVWTLFGALAFAGDVGLHRMVERLEWLDARPGVVTGGVLVLAGAFQFSALKDRCLDACRHPAARLLRHYRRGTAAAWRLGWGHGLFCLGCCWALMLLMFAAGVANLAWMALLAGVMTYEKVGRHRARVTPVVGVVLLALGPAGAAGAI